jgi:hypothetical protein
MLTQMAKESGIETPTADHLVRLDRARKGKKLSNKEWTSKTDPEAKLAKLKDGRTHLAYKPEHAVDLDTGVIVAAALHPADNGDTTTIEGTLSAAEKNLAQIGAAPTTDKPSELVADKGYHSRAGLKDLDGGAWKTRIAEPKQPGFSRWHGDDKARAAVYANRTRLGSEVGKEAMRRRAEIVERSFAHNLDRGGMRRTWLRGRENVPQALSGPRRRPQSRHPHAAADRGRNPERGGCLGADLSALRLHRADCGADPCCPIR